jgi:hypothetical protein
MNISLKKLQNSSDLSINTKKKKIKKKIKDYYIKLLYKTFFEKITLEIILYETKNTKQNLQRKKI